MTLQQQEQEHSIGSDLEKDNIKYYTYNASPSMF